MSDAETLPGYEEALKVCSTGGDLELPIEVVHDGKTAVAARMEFVSDVGELEGWWLPIGEIEITKGRCVACDPYCHADIYRFVFPIAPGRYITEVFRQSTGLRAAGSGEVLGVRIRQVANVEAASDRVMTR